MRKLACFMTLVCVAVPVHAVTNEQSHTSEITVRIQQTEPATVVYVEHTGPYWTVRARLSEVVAYQRSHGLTGAVYVRYGSDPTGRNAGAIRSEIGFLTRNDDKPEQPFQRASRDAEWVVSMPMAKHGTFTPRHYRKLLDWVKANGYRPLGPMIEWYPDGFGKPVEGRKREPASLRVPIEPPESSPPSEESTGNDLEVVVEAKAAVADPSSVASSPATSASAATKPVPPAQPPPVPPATEKARGAVTTRDAGMTQTKKPPKPGDERPIPPSHTEPSSVSFVDDGTLSMAALLEAGHVDAIVQRLMPVGQPIAPELDLWLGQIVFRISAAGKGLARTYPQEKERVSPLAKVIKNRYRTASTELSGRVLSQVIVRVPRGGSQSATERQSVLRDMDRLLSRIAMKAVDAHQARTELAGLLGRAEAILSENRSDSP